MTDVNDPLGIGERHPNLSNERALRKNAEDFTKIRDQARRYMVAVYGDAVFYMAPEMFDNILVRWIYAIASGAIDFAEEQMKRIEEMAADDHARELANETQQEP